MTPQGVGVNPVGTVVTPPARPDAPGTRPDAPGARPVAWTRALWLLFGAMVITVAFAGAYQTLIQEAPTVRAIAVLFAVSFLSLFSVARLVAPGRKVEK